MGAVGQPSGQMTRVQQLDRARPDPLIVVLETSEKVQTGRVVAHFELRHGDARLLETGQRRLLTGLQGVRQDLVKKNGGASSRQCDIGFSLRKWGGRFPRLCRSRERGAQLVGRCLGAGSVKGESPHFIATP